MSEDPHTPQPPGSAPQSEPSSLPEAGIAPEVSRRVSSILDAVEREAARLREDATEEAGRYLDYSRRRADALVADRQRRIAELSDEIMAKAEAVVGKLDDAAPVREGFESLVRALGDAAERLSQEAERTRHAFDPPAFYDEAAQAQQPAAEPGPPAQQPPQGGYGAATAGPDPGYQPQPPRTPQPFQPPAAGYGLQQDTTYQPTPAPGAQQQPGPQPPPAQAPAPHPPTRGAPEPPLDEPRLVAIQMAAGGSTRGQVREHLQRTLRVPQTSEILDEIFGRDSGEDARVPWTASR